MSENLLNLVNTIRDRKNKDEDKSYTSSLLSGGLSKCIDKMEEEFDELKEALNDKSNIVHEAADTIYHILVTLEAADIKFEDVLKELEDRKKQAITEVSKILGISTDTGKGYRALTNLGEDGGQEVPHLHFHLFGGEKVGKMVE